MSISSLKGFDTSRINKNSFPSDKTIKNIEKMVLDGKERLYFLISW